MIYWQPRKNNFKFHKMIANNQKKKKKNTKKNKKHQIYSENGMYSTNSTITKTALFLIVLFIDPSDLR